MLKLFLFTLIRKDRDSDLNSVLHGCVSSRQFSMLLENCPPSKLNPLLEVNHTGSAADWDFLRFPEP